MKIKIPEEAEQSIYELMTSTVNTTEKALPQNLSLGKPKSLFHGPNPHWMLFAP